MAKEQKEKLVTSPDLDLEPKGHFVDARKWLLKYLEKARFKNPLVNDALPEDWSAYSQIKAAYLLGVIWGRLRQNDSSLEQASDYAKLVEHGFEETNTELTEKGDDDAS